MPSKNPTKGYVLCPTEGCGEICTVHAVGEHRAMTEGETPKNPRRLGQLYTICPKCKTNQSAGKPFQDWLTEHMKPTQAEVKAVTPLVKVSDKPEGKPNEPIKKPVSKPNQTSKDEALAEKALKPNQTELKPDETEKSNLIGLGLSLLGLISACGFLFWAVSSAKKKQQETAPCKKAA